MKKIFFHSLFCLLSFILFAQNKSNDSLPIADTGHTATERLIRQNDSIIQLKARYEDSMRMLFNEKNNTEHGNTLLSDTNKKESKRTRQLYFRIGLAVFFLGLLVFRLVKKRKK